MTMSRTWRARLTRLRHHGRRIGSIMMPGMLGFPEALNTGGGWFAVNGTCEGTAFFFGATGPCEPAGAVFGSIP